MSRATAYDGGDDHIGEGHHSCGAGACVGGNDHIGGRHHSYETGAIVGGDDHSCEGRHSCEAGACVGGNDLIGEGHRPREAGFVDGHNHVGKGIVSDEVRGKRIAWADIVDSDDAEEVGDVSRHRKKKQNKPNKAARKRNQQRRVELEDLQAAIARCDELLASFTTKAATKQMRAYRARLIMQLADEFLQEWSVLIGVVSVQSL